MTRILPAQTCQMGPGQMVIHDLRGDDLELRRHEAHVVVEEDAVDDGRLEKSVRNILDLIFRVPVGRVPFADLIGAAEEVDMSRHLPKDEVQIGIAWVGVAMMAVSA